MKEQIHKIYRRQLLGLFSVWGICILFAILYEAGLLHEGYFAGDGRMDYILQSVGILLTIIMIPLALRMFALNLMKRIRQLPLRYALSSYRIWSDVRLCLLFVPIFLNLQFYYLTLNTTGLFCSMMALMASLFCIPSEKRIKKELDLPEEIEA